MTLIATCRNFQVQEFSTPQTRAGVPKERFHMRNFLIALENSFMILHLFHFPPVGEGKVLGFVFKLKFICAY